MLHAIRIVIPYCMDFLQLQKGGTQYYHHPQGRVYWEEDSDLVENRL
jgi:hypothetical protein